MRSAYSLATLALLFPHQSVAQTTYSLLAPLGPLSGAVTLGQYLAGIVQVIIGLAGILAVVMIVICGVQMIGSPSVSQKSASKECITNALFGVLLAISSWLILNTINAQLLQSDIPLQNLPAAPSAPPASTIDAPLPRTPGWYYRYRGQTGRIENSPRWPTPEACLEALTQDKADGIAIEKTPPGSTIECFQVFPPPPGQPLPPPGAPPIPTPANEAAARRAICGNDSCVGATPVGINRGPCTSPGQTTCTNVAGLPMSAINVIKGLPGPVVITGGTEPGHKTHRPNAPIFDLRKTQSLDTYIRQNSTQSAVSFWPCRYLLNNFWFTDEGDHWHVCEVGQPYWFCTDKDKAGNTLPAGTYINCPRN